MPHGVHAVVDRMQAAAFYPALNGAAAEAAPSQLPPRRHPMLPRGQLGQADIRCHAKCTYTVHVEGHLRS